MAETNSAVKFYRTTSSAFSSATKEDGALYFLTDNGKIYLVVGTGSSQTLYQMSVSPSDIVSNVAQGDSNGQIKITKNGSASNVSVKGLKSAAYTESTDYATSGHTHDTRYVRFDTNSQGLTSTQKSNARTNIGAGTSSFSGSYNDLTNKPTIPAAQVNSDWNSSSGVSQILNKPTLASVATSGSYSDLSNKPSIPSKDSDLSTNDRYVRFDTSSQGLTSTQKSNARTNIGAGTSSFSGSYNDLTNKPTIPAAQVNSDWNASSGVAQILNKPTLATVATSGSYSDLSNKPSIPSKDSDITNDQYVRFDTNSQGLSSTQKSNARTNIGAGTSSFSGSYNDLTNKPTIPAAQVNSDWNASSGVAQILNKPTLATVATSGSYSDLSNKPSIPSKDSDITNDQYVRFDTNSQGLTSTQKSNARTNIGAGTSSFSGSYNDLSNKPSIPSKDSDLSTNDRYVRFDTNSQGLSSTQKSNARTNIGAGTSSFSGSYNDLTNKPTIPAAQVNSDWNASSGVAQILNKPTLATVATSGSYNDLSNKPTIPATNNIPSVSTANKVLLSTGTGGTAAWSSWSNAGFLKTNSSGVVSIDTNTYSTSGHTHTLSLAADSGTSTIDLQSNTKYKLTAGGNTLVFKTPAGGGGSTLYRHNLEWVFKTGSSSSGYIYIHFYAYLITNSSTVYTYSTYFSNINTLFKKTVLCGGLYDYSSQEDYGYDGISTVWQPNYSKSGNLNGVYVRYMRESDDSTWDTSTYITSSTTAYSFTDTVETLS